jgi:hypothetical protein
VTPEREQRSGIGEENSRMRAERMASARSFGEFRSRTVVGAGLLYPDFRTPTTIVAFECWRDGLHFDQVPAMEPQGTNRIL